MTSITLQTELKEIRGYNGLSVRTRNTLHMLPSNGTPTVSDLQDWTPVKIFQSTYNFGRKSMNELIWWLEDNGITYDKNGNLTLPAPVQKRERKKVKYSQYTDIEIRKTVTQIESGAKISGIVVYGRTNTSIRLLVRRMGGIKRLRKEIDLLGVDMVVDIARDRVDAWKKKERNVHSIKGKPSLARRIMSVFTLVRGQNHVSN